MNDQGFVVLSRKLLNSPLWLKEAFTPGQAWADMFGLANWGDQYFFNGWSRVDIQRGQLSWSEVKLAERWKWSRGKVRRFMDMLKREQMIVQETVQGISIITICNYRKYNDLNQEDGTANDTEDSTGSSTANGQATVQRTDRQRTGNGTHINQTNQNNINKKNKQKKISTGSRIEVDDMPEELQILRFEHDQRKLGGNGDLLNAWDDAIDNGVSPERILAGHARWKKTTWVKNGKFVDFVPGLTRFIREKMFDVDPKSGASSAFMHCKKCGKECLKPQPGEQRSENLCYQCDHENSPTIFSNDWQSSAQNSNNSEKLNGSAPEIEKSTTTLAAQVAEIQSHRRKVKTLSKINSDAAANEIIESRPDLAGLGV